MCTYQTQINSFRPKVRSVRSVPHYQARQVLISRQSHPNLLSDDVLRPVAEGLLRAYGEWYAMVLNLSHRYAQGVLQYDSNDSETSSITDTMLTILSKAIASPDRSLNLYSIRLLRYLPYWPILHGTSTRSMAYQKKLSTRILNIDLGAISLHFSDVFRWVTVYLQK